MNKNEGQLHTLSVLEQLREASKSLWGASSEAYFRVDELLRQLANPNLHDIPRDLPFRVEMWDQTDQHIRARGGLQSLIELSDGSTHNIATGALTAAAGVAARSAAASVTDARGHL
jgi:hypothetical protein